MFLLNLIKQDRGGQAFLAILILVSILVPLLNQLVPESSAFHISTYTVTLLGKYLTYALLALAVDLVWGYLGILSLGHGAFFALGGYAMGMYLMRQIGDRGVYGDPLLPDFMVFLDWKELPWFWLGFDQFWFALLMAGAGDTGLCIRLACISLQGDRCLSLYHDPGLDLCIDAGVFPE